MSCMHLLARLYYLMSKRMCLFEIKKLERVCSHAIITSLLLVLPVSLWPLSPEHTHIRALDLFGFFIILFLYTTKVSDTTY